MTFGFAVLLLTTAYHLGSGSSRDGDLIGADGNVTTCTATGGLPMAQRDVLA